MSSASGSTVTVADDVCTRPWRLGHRHPLHAVGATLVLQPRPHAVALHEEGDVAVAPEIGRLATQDLELPAPLGCVPAVHLEQVAGEEVGLLAPLGASDLDDHVAALVGVLRQQQQLDLLVEAGDVGLGRVDLATQQLTVVGIGVSVHLLGRRQVVAGLTELAGARHDRVELLVALGHLGVALADPG